MAGKAKGNNKEKLPQRSKAPTRIAIAAIAVVLFIIPWIIGVLVPPMSGSGFTVKNNCMYIYELIIGAAVALSVFNKLLSSRLAKGSSQWKVFLLFEVTLLVSTAIVIFLTNVVCTFNPVQF